MNFLVGPVVGGIIGYITNSIAIKMLFRPLKPIYFLGKRLPFTPGMIPREQERIAKTIGEVVGRELIDEETLKKQLLSQNLIVKIEQGMDTWINQQKQSDLVLEEALFELLGKDTCLLLSRNIEESLGKATYEKIVSMRLGEPLAKQAVSAIGGSLGGMTMFLGAGFMETAEAKLVEIINEMIEARGEEVIEEVMTKEKDKLLQTPVKEVIDLLEERLPKIKYIVINQYVNMVQNQLKSMIGAVDIPNMVEEKIKSYDVLEMEKLILSIVKKELNAIVWLGALLGALMGIIMNFV